MRPSSRLAAGLRATAMLVPVALVLVLVVVAVAARAAATTPGSVGSSGSSGSADTEVYDPDEFEGFDDVGQVDARGQVVNDEDDDDEFEAPHVAADEDLDDDDDDEEVVEQQHVGGGAATAAPSPLQAAQLPVPRTYEWEAVAIGIIFLYAVVFFAGKSKNEAIAIAWIKQMCPLFEAHFSSVGIGSDAGGLLMKESNALFKFFASGRRFCVGLLVEVQLRNRQDLFSLLYNLIFPVQDMVTIEIPMNDEDMDTFVFAVVRKAQRKQVHGEMNDLKQYAKQVASDAVPSQFVVLTDCSEVLADILVAPVRTALRQYEQYFQMLHITDEAPVREGAERLSKKAIRMQINIPPVDKMAEMQPLVEMALYLIDVVGAIRLSREASRSAQAKRSAALAETMRASHHERQEAIVARKQAQRAKDQEEYEKLTPEQKRRRDEKDAKKNAKKNVSGRFKVKTLRA